MRRLLFIYAILLLSLGLKSWASLAFSTFQHCNQSSTTILTCSAAMTFASGDFVVLYASEDGSGFTYTVSDSCNQAWVRQSSASFTQGTLVQIDAWTVSNATAGSCTVTVTRSATATRRFQWVAATYSGAWKLGAMTSGGNGNSGTCSVSLTTQDNNNFVVAGFTNSAAETYTANTGNLRGQDNNTAGASALNDNSAVSPGSVTNTVSLSSSASCAKGAIELRACGPPAYNCSYSGVDAKQWPNPIPNIGTTSNNNLDVIDTSYGLTQPGIVHRCTDRNSANYGGQGRLNVGYSAGLGGSGDGVLWDTSSSMMHVNITTGNTGIVLFNNSMRACTQLITQNLDQTNPNSNTTLTVSFGGGGFSLGTAGKWIGYGATYCGPSCTTATTTQARAYSINGGNGQCTTLGTNGCGQFTYQQIADLVYGLPISNGVAGNAPAWTHNTVYGFGAIVSYTLASTQYPSWGQGVAFSLGDIIHPITGCSFKVTVAGTTGTMAPNWSSKCPQGTAVDNGVTWREINDNSTNLGPTFVFQQMTVGGCTSGASAPTFLNLTNATTQMPQGHPDLLSITNESSPSTCSWENIGPNVTPPWSTFGGTGDNDAYITVGTSNETYGSGPSGTGAYGNWNGDQGTGIFAVQYDQATNTYHLYNTATGIATDYKCTGGSGYNCSGGSFTTTVLGQVNDNCRTYIHNVKGPYGNYAIIAKQATISGTCTPGFFVWRAPQTPFNAGTQIVEMTFQPNHWAVGKNDLFAEATSNWSCTGKGSCGVFGTITPLSDPQNFNTPPADWTTAPGCSTTPPYTSTPPCTPSNNVDSHLSWAYNPSEADTSPACGTMYNVATLSPVEYMAWQGEEICVTTTPTTTTPLNGNPGQKQSRFTHTFAGGSNPNFDGQFQISQMSQDGNYLAFTTDWMGANANGSVGLGCNTSGCAAPTVANGQLIVNPPSGITYTCLGSPVWQPTTSYATGALVGPIAGTSGSGAVFDVFQATTGGTTSSTAPNWATCTGVHGCNPNGTGGTDGTVTWQEVGKGNCASDVVVVQLK
ncbi:MAG TPA: hypothetical protein VNX26_05490 [Candidatus Acidoferrum sp.]|jgi:hypothetical protein|nr:hypothetical protein [Candidatus Acidoferrum sp.]